MIRPYLANKEGDIVVNVETKVRQNHIACVWTRSADAQ